MSLIKQLWIAIAIVMSLAFGGSLVVSTLSARHYLEQQLYIKNLDNASSLALSLSQMPKDDVTVELQISAQFDAGHYQLIRLTRPDGEVMVERQFSSGELGAPQWFSDLIPINVSAGVAQVQDGWHQFGTLTLESHSRFAYAALWNATLQLLAWFALGGAVTGLIGTAILKLITRPLGSIVAQAEAMGGRRFITTPEPSTREFRSVVRAMNALTERVKNMLTEESARLEALRCKFQHDELTGLVNRNQFLNLLDAALTREDTRAGGTLVIARFTDLAEMNKQLGHANVDQLLQTIGKRLHALTDTEAGLEAGRLNNTDFALLAQGHTATEDIAAQLADALHTTLDATDTYAAVHLPVGASDYHTGEARGQLLARVDGALAAAEQIGSHAIHCVTAEQKVTHPDLAAWRTALTLALDGNNMKLATFPVVSSDGQLLHFETPVRMFLDGDWQGAGYFLPWAARLGLMSRIDANVVKLALEHIAADSQPIGINLSSESLCDASFRGDLFALLHDNPAAAVRLWIELPEYGVLRHLAEFRALCLALKPLGCKLGIEHVGRQFNRIGDLHDLGLDYIKIDTSMIRGIDSDTGNQSFLRGLCVVAHAIGLAVIAEGVTTEAEATALKALGLDGMTGAGVHYP